MRNRMRRVGAGVLALMSAIASTGCDTGQRTASDADESRVFGDVSLGLVLPDGTHVSAVNFVVTRNGAEVRSGTMQVGSDGRASITIASLDAGAGYHVELTAAGDAGSSCKGEADFAVNDGQTTNVNVVLQCAERTVEGNITINGSFNVCPVIRFTTASPVTVAVGSNTALTTAATDRDGDVLSYAWTATDGAFSAPTALNTQYTCMSAGEKTLTIGVTDGPTRGCTRTATATITCVGGLDAGLDGGTDGAVESGADGGADSSTDGGAPNDGGAGGVLSASMLTLGGSASCWVVPTDERLACWGLDTFNTLANGALSVSQTVASYVDTRALPQGLATRWKAVSASGGPTACGITAAGDAYCWGSASDGVLGDGLATSVAESPRAVDIQALPRGTTWSMVTVGNSFACAVTSDGTGYCWGNQADGKLGNGATAGTQVSPVAIDMSALPPGTKWARLSAASSHACGITTAGTAYCWGLDTSGQLGNGAINSTQARPSPVDVTALPSGTSWAEISAGFTHTCGITAAGAAYCWGLDDRGQLGNGALPATVSPSPVDVGALPSGIAWSQISAVGNGTCAVTNGGAAYCWGQSNNGRLGIGATGADAMSPVAVDLSAMPAGTAWVAVQTQTTFSCGLTTQGAAYCWGRANNGLLGNGLTSGNQTRPALPVALKTQVLIDTRSIGATMGDADNAALSMTLVPVGTSLDGITIAADSSNTATIPVSRIGISGAGGNRIVSFAPLARGTSTLTFTVTDSGGRPTVFPIDYQVSGAAPDPSGRYHYRTSDASSAIDVGDGYMVLADDEVNTLFLFKQNESGLPVKTWQFAAVDQLGPRELDLEAAARVGDRILWTSSQANGRTGEIQEYRRVLFATAISGVGANVELAFAGRYGGADDKTVAAQLGLRSDLLSWDHNNVHGLGVDYLRFLPATQAGVLPNAPNGFNVEGLEFAANGTTGYLGFRAPTVQRSGVQAALIVPVENILDLVNGIQLPQSGRARFGAPIFLDLGGRSIRDLRRNDFGEYVISAGPPDGATVGVNDKWALYTWDGVAGHDAVFNRELPTPDTLTGGTWESIASVPHPLVPGAVVRLVTDSGDTTFYSNVATKDLSATDLKKSYSQKFTLQ